VTPTEYDPLDEDEFAALRQLGRSSSRGTIAPAIGTRLKALGYANEIMETLIITDKGSVRLAAGNL
jgi:hypothetical protein